MVITTYWLCVMDMLDLRCVRLSVWIVCCCDGYVLIVLCIKYK